VLLRLRLRLTQNQHEFLLLFAEDCPHRIRGREDGRLCRATKRDDEKIFYILSLGEVEQLVLEWRGCVLHIVREVEVEEHEVALSRNRGANAAVAEHFLRKLGR
jgi:hypothetical protein